MNERDEILGRLQDATTEVLGEDAPVLTEETALGDDTIDSLDLVEILMVIEDREGFVIDAESVSDVTTIAGLIDVVLARRRVEVG